MKWVAVVMLTVVAVAGAIYLGGTRDVRRQEVRAHRAQQPQEQVQTRVVEPEPGVTELEVQRGGEQRRVRVQKVGEDVMIQEVPPEKPKRKWWQRR